MKVDLRRVNNAVHFEGTSHTSKVKVHIDGIPEIGGEGAGSRPMELVLMALGSCSSFDLLHILKKQKQEVNTFFVSIEAKCREIRPSIFTNIHIAFNISGNLQAAKVEQAAALAVKKYCPVYQMLVAGGVEIDYSIQIG